MFWSVSCIKLQLKEWDLLRPNQVAGLELTRLFNLEESHSYKIDYAEFWKVAGNGRI
jgi:hypothetical protein